MTFGLCSKDSRIESCMFQFACRFAFYRAMHCSAKRGVEIACRLSVCDVGGSGLHKLEILETNSTDN